MSEYNPGPWHSKRAKFRVDGEYDYGISCDINGNLNVIAEAFGRSGKNTYPNAKANGDLISAAPDMYEALKAINNYWLEDFPGGPNEPDDTTNELAKLFKASLSPETILVWRQIQSALAKAEGKEL